MLNHAQIEALVPHAGRMCLLDQVAHWNATHIVCKAAAPAKNHPLSTARGVPVVVAVEYAAQAAALHGALLDGGQAPCDGMLAKLTDVELLADRIDESSGQLTVQAQLRVRSASGCIYSFTVDDEHGCRARGRVLVALANNG